MQILQYSIVTIEFMFYHTSPTFVWTASLPTYSIQMTRILTHLMRLSLHRSKVIVPTTKRRTKNNFLQKCDELWVSSSNNIFKDVQMESKIIKKHQIIMFICYFLDRRYCNGKIRDWDFMCGGGGRVCVAQEWLSPFRSNLNLWILDNCPRT